MNRYTDWSCLSLSKGLHKFKVDFPPSPHRSIVQSFELKYIFLKAGSHCVCVCVCLASGGLFTSIIGQHLCRKREGGYCKNWVFFLFAFIFLLQTTFHPVSHCPRLLVWLCYEDRQPLFSVNEYQPLDQTDKSVFYSVYSRIVCAGFQNKEVIASFVCVHGSLERLDINFLNKYIWFNAFLFN